MKLTGHRPKHSLDGAQVRRAIRSYQLSTHPLCAYHLQRELYVEATVCHHANPADKDSPETFFRGPFESLCKGCHDSAGKKEDKRGHIIGRDVNGIPLDPSSHWHK